MTPEPTHTTFDQVIEDMVANLLLDESQLREAFTTWLSGTRLRELSDEMNIACYAIYHLTKTTWAVKACSNSRARWREAALARGADPILANNFEPDAT